ncbi:MAG: PHP domain-containing protein [Lachnospiraceae bacterium]|nr:PHP domain-containing protein [Lachnospiraceae bacterium]
MIKKIDLHMHSTVSDGTDTPEIILENVRAAGIDLFSLTDHDAIKGCLTIRSLLKDGDPAFISGVEFSCKDEDGKYHILGYGYDPALPSILNVVEAGHSLRMRKLDARLDFLKDEYGFEFSSEDVDMLHSIDNPGKPHIGNLMVKYGYAESKNVAIDNYLNKLKAKTGYVRPEQAIEGIAKAGGIPVLAHPAYGSGEELILGAEMEARLKKLIGFGLKGMEAFYSGFTDKIQDQMLGFAERYGLYITAGSDYHGKNKLVPLADTNLYEDPSKWPKGLNDFLKKNGMIS